MPFNGSGSYSAPSNSWNPAVPNTAITSDDWNTLLADMSLALTTCLTKDGQSTTSARIGFAVGTSATGSSASAVAYAATSDVDTGVYFPAANEVGIAAGGVAIMTATSTTVTFPVAVTFAASVTFSANLTVTGNLTVNGNTTIGNAAGDTLTVNATGTFAGNQTFSGTATFNGTATFTSTVTVPDATFTNAKLANMATQTIKGRTTAGSGAPEDLTATQATAILNAFTGDSGSGGVKGLVPAPAAGDAANRKVLAADGTWQNNELKARGVFDGATGNTVAARGISLSRITTGEYTATLSPALANADYEVQLTCSSAGLPIFAVHDSGTKTTSSFDIVVFNSSTSLQADPTQLYIAVLA